MPLYIVSNCYWIGFFEVLPVNIPARVNSLALSTALELLHGNGANVLEMVGARIRDNTIPNDGRVCGVLRARPFCCYVYEDFFRVPVEEAREIGVEGESNDGVLLLLGAVVVRAALDTIFYPLWLAFGNSVWSIVHSGGLHLKAVGLDDARWCSGSEEVGGSDEGAKEAGYCCEEAEDILNSGEAVVHGGRMIYGCDTVFMTAAHVLLMRIGAGG